MGIKTLIGHLPDKINLGLRATDTQLTWLGKDLSNYTPCTYTQGTKVHHNAICIVLVFQMLLPFVLRAAI